MLIFFSRKALYINTNMHDSYLFFLFRCAILNPQSSIPPDICFFLWHIHAKSTNSKKGIEKENEFSETNVTHLSEIL